MMTRFVLCLSFLQVPTSAWAQTAEGWRERFAAGQQALAAEDFETYAAEMRAAAERMPPALLNRPFVQYHAARAAALAGRPNEAVSWLRLAWEEDIEALMISFARYDPAFEPMRTDDDFARLMTSLSDLDVTTQSLGGPVHLLRGAGSNVLVQTGQDGAVLVDTGYAPALPALRRALASLGAGEVRHVLITHPHEDHLGGASELAAGVTIVAHPRTGVAMGEPYVFMEGVQVPPKPPEARPDVMVGRDTVLVLNGEEVRVLALEAHTDADLVVYFTESRVAHLGDLYLAGNPMMFPGRHDPDGFLRRLEAFLDALHPETVVVGGHDEPVDIASVRAQIEETRACMAYVRQAMAAERSAEEAAAAAAGRFAPQWIAFFYGLLL